MNHVVFFNQQAAPSNQSLLQWGAVQQLRSIGVQHTIEENDFVVLDTLLHVDVIDYLFEVLSTSFIWFDSTNGAAFASHWDDGLSQISTLASIAKVVELFLPKVYKYISLSSFYFSKLLLRCPPVGPRYRSRKCML
jgi:hypothetical protein